MKKQRPKLPKRKIGEGDYTEDRKQWADSITLEDVLRERTNQPDSKLLAELERAKKRRRGRKAS